MSETVSRNGKIFLVGLGPGSAEHMSGRARDAIVQADVVIGYSTYIKLVADMLDGKQVVRKGMTEELDRCYEALAAAREGKTVALVSSGDSGVYGMAGPTYEVLFQSGWQPGDGVEVEVVPGSSAINSCAALVGAPLTHDFCSISLSDLLTPWPVIAGRLDAAAKADFVVALYNPKSGRRTGQIVEAQRIMLLHRSANTPVALIKSGYRRRQAIHLTTLDQMAECDIGMLTTVLIGNSNTFVKHGLMVTPRGYANKYSVQKTAEEDAERARDRVHDGEQAGRSHSMGLLGWKSYVRGYLRENEQHTLRQAADQFAMPMADILSAVACRLEHEPACPYQSVQVKPDSLDAMLGLVQEWGPLRAVVRSDAGGVAELLLNGEAFERSASPGKADWLNIVTPHFHLHVNWRQVSQAWLVGRNGLLQGAYFLDAKGHLLLSLLPREGRSEHAAKRPFELDDIAQQFDLVPVECEQSESVEGSTDE